MILLLLDNLISQLPVLRYLDVRNDISDRIWENPPYGIFSEN